MLGNSKYKKGSSLIEIIISMALLSILMIPLSTSIIQVTKINQKGELSQIASFEGQKILEEFKGYSEISLDGDKFTLLNGEEVIKDSTKDEFTSNFEVKNGNNTYEVDLLMKKDDTFDNSITDEAEKFFIDFNENDKMVVDKVHSKSFKSNCIIIRISNNSGGTSNYDISIYQKNDAGLEYVIYQDKIKDLDSRKMVINVARKYTKELNILVENLSKTADKKELDFEVNIYKADDEESRGIIDVSSVKGSNVIRINRNLQVEANGILEQLYKINISVRKKGQSELLFESSNTQNIKIS